MTRRVVEKLCTKKVCVDFFALTPSDKGKRLPTTGQPAQPTLWKIDFSLSVPAALDAPTLVWAQANPNDRGPRLTRTRASPEAPDHGRNHALVIAKSLARVIAAIRITSVLWRSYLLPKPQNVVLIDPTFVALRFELRYWRSFV